MYLYIAFYSDISISSFHLRSESLRLLNLFYTLHTLILFHLNVLFLCVRTIPVEVRESRNE